MGDLLTVRFINLATVQIILSVHVVLAGLWIAVIHSKKDLIEDTGIYKYLRLFAPLALYYSFSALFSMFLVLYSNSGSLFTSAPFLIVIALLFIGTEAFKKQFQRLQIQVVVYFTALFSFLILVVPYVFRQIGSIMFLASGIISLVIILGYLALLRKVSREAKEKAKPLYLYIAGIFIFINLLYFTNTIPPFPLSVRDIGIYQSVSRSSEGTYHAVRNQKSFLDIISPIDTIYIHSSRSTLFTFSAIFAPTELDTHVVHEWKRWQNGRFRVVNRVEYPISGGRNDGYRGYTYSSNITPGFWWVTVETSDGKVIGGTMFVVKNTTKKLPKVVDVF